MKGKKRIVMITSYDYPTTKIISEIDTVDAVLVGDSLGMVVYGLPNTLGVTTDMMIRHTQAVARAKPPQLIVSDMPFLSYEPSTRDAVINAGELAKAGADAVKLEGGEEMAHVIKAIVRAGVPVMGHIGMTPQRFLRLGGFRVVGKRQSEREQLLRDAESLENAGVFSVVIENTYADLAKEITERISVPTICIGAGPHCDGQVLVLHDVLGLSETRPYFAKAYADLWTTIKDAISKYAKEVLEGAFPSKEHYRVSES
jgi:3-methyl-2-oxobutanoate hydroxymethyltransferase